MGQVITLQSKLFVNLLKTNEVMLALMSSYGELYLEWLNNAELSDLSDVTFANRGGLHHVRKFVDGISKLAQKRVLEDQDAAEKKERKLAQKREKEAKRDLA